MEKQPDNMPLQDSDETCPAADTRGKQPDERPLHASSTARRAASGNRKGLVIMVVALALLVIAASIAYAALSTASDSDATVLVSQEAGSSSTAATSSTGTSGAGAAGKASTDSAEAQSASGSASSAADTSSVLPNTPDSRQAATDVTLLDEDGNSVKLSSIIGNGKPTILEFWATWCPYCKQELTIMDGVVSDYAGRFNFVPIDSVGSKSETVEKALQFMSDNGHDYPTYFDTNSQAAATAYHAYSLPTIIVIDRYGNYVGYHTGLMQADDISAILDALLAE